jgi:hypothetical protein
MGTSQEVREAMFLTGVYLFPNALASQGKLSVQKAGWEIEA